MSIGSFIISSQSFKPSLIVAKDELYNLVTIYEYGGDYMWLNEDECTIVNLSPQEELSILSNYGDWFYSIHKILFQEIILKNLYYHFEVNKKI